MKTKSSKKQGSSFCDMVAGLMFDMADLMDSQPTNFTLQVVPEIWWKRIREQYIEISKFVKMLGHEVQFLVLLSFACNVYCIQLYRALRQVFGYEQGSRFFISNKPNLDHKVFC